MLRKLSYFILLISVLMMFGCKISGTVTDESDVGVPGTEKTPLPPPINNSFGMTFNPIPAGTFMMGSPTDEPGRYSNSDETLHEVTLTQDFYMQATEVTQGQWEAVLTEAENRGISIGELSKTPSYFSSHGVDYPVEQVSYDAIEVFIKALNLLGEGTYSLPTEAQWEYAARAGSITAFANGPITVIGCALDPNLDAIGWYCYNNTSYTTKSVAQKDANAWGLFDMHGNVSEWCQDGYQSDLGSDPVIDPKGHVSGSLRVKHGGNYHSYASRCRSASRSKSLPEAYFIDIGFRLALLPGQ